ncbi:response regulator transcription factor [Amycolatopsis suaedae]|uniref:Response regulator transcription factor n=1 Tax=Amycolatopsis suaedae TaxID=2510978 RepID=A0A4Q7J5F3_9PSEU|nr:response regulator transcription factor [Amycolatopsis suaedae]RZQ61533.1 response regulator transcription factor [Amycolatopsis suaedae]
MRVLVVEDVEDLRRGIHSSLRTAGFAVDAAADLPEADEALHVNTYDCAVFDRMLPSGDALAYVARRRQAGWAVPVLFLTGLGSVPERLDGLRHADDYLVKPFDTAELVARVRSLCRRAGAAASPLLRVADVELDTARHEVRRAGVLLTLTRTEFAVLERLLTDADRPVSRAELIRHAWDEMADPASNVLDVVIAQLRRKLRKPPLIHTVRGTGYQAGAPPG